MSTRILIRGGTVLALDSKVGNHTEADVLIDDGLIAEVGPGLRARDATVIDATDTIVMPGFVDTHRHAWTSLFRNLGALGPDAAKPTSDLFLGHCTPDDIYVATLVGLLGAAEAGVTTVADWSDIPEGDEFRDAARQAHTESGIRTVHIQSATAIGGDVGPRTTVAHGSPAITKAHLDTIRDAWPAARSGGLHIHAHAGTSPDDVGALGDLAGGGLLGSDLTLVHGTHLSDAELDAVAASGASLSVNPSSEMAGQLGSPPIQEMLDRKIPIALGIDDEHLAPGDMFAQMRATISVQHATYFDLKLAGKAGLPNLLTTREMIRYGTIDGARALGLGDVTGSLTPGKRADLIGLRTDRPNIYPINDPIGAVVWGMDTSNISWVLVDGSPVVQDRALLADVDRIRDLASAAQQRVAQAAGLTVTTGLSA